MSFTYDQLILSQGSNLTDDELDQLEEIVALQRADRSKLAGDLDFDRTEHGISKTEYQLKKYEYTTRSYQYTPISYQEALQIAKTGRHPGNNKYYRISEIECKGKESKQFRFVRMTLKRRDKALRAIQQLRGTPNNSNFIDFPTATETLQLLEKEISDLRARYEEEAEKLIKRAEKKGVKFI